jgi:hypothetical protein
MEDLGGFNLITFSFFKPVQLEKIGEDLGGLFSLDLYLKVLSFKIILIQNDRLKCRTHPQPFPWKWKGVHMYYNYIFLTHYIPNHYLKVLPF